MTSQETCCDSEQIRNSEPTEKAPSRNSQGTFARVRQEFLRDEPSWTKSDDGDVQKHHTGFRKRSKIMKQNQKVTEINLCNLIRKGLPCPFENCKFSHDVENYLKERPQDIADKCPVLQELGFCPMGFACRYVGAHPTKELFRNPMLQEKHENAAEAQRNLLKKLHAREYEFLGSDTRKNERKNIDLRGKVYVAPLTTVGNLPFRRILVELGADVTCGEMAVAHQLLKGSPSEWALLKRHPSEKIFGVQIAGCHPQDMGKIAELISRETEADFIDVNMGCPIDDITNHGGGSALMKRPNRILQIVEAITKAAPSVPLGLKMRTGWDDDKKLAHKIIEALHPVSKQLTYLMVHGRSRLQRYTKCADWNYIAGSCAPAAKAIDVQFVGNGDILHWEDYKRATTPISEGGIMDPEAPIATALIGRGALIKPWICTEIKEQRVWDISASERLDLIKRFSNYGLEHWGSDQRGVDTTRRYLLEWLSFAHRYVPVGICEEGYLQHVNHRPPFAFSGRSDLETLLSSPSSRDWEKVVEMFLGPSPEGFHFVPKHKANAW